MRILLIVIILGLSTTLFSQKKPLIEEYNKVVEVAKKQLDEAMKEPEGELFLYKQETNIQGVFDFDITLHEKGKVATVFVRGNEGGTIKMQNHLKDYVKELQFNFKMPKGKDYKFNYVFNFNN